MDQRTTFSETAPEERDTAAGSDDRMRIVTRASLRYLVSALSTFIEESGTDAIDVLLLLTLTTLNVAHLRNDKSLDARYATPASPTPLDERRPARLEDIADTIRIPLEEARTRIGGLIALGIVMEREGGLVGIYETYDPDAVMRLSRMNMAFVMQFVRELDRNGVVFDAS